MDLYAAAPPGMLLSLSILLLVPSTIIVVGVVVITHILIVIIVFIFINIVNRILLVSKTGPDGLKKKKFFRCGPDQMGDTSISELLFGRAHSGQSCSASLAGKPSCRHFTDCDPLY